MGYALTKNQQWSWLLAVGLVVTVVVAFLAHAVRRKAPQDEASV